MRAMRWGLGLVLLPMLIAAPPVTAQQPNFAGKTIKLIVGGAPGGGYDLYGRLVAQHLTRHLPGQPIIVVQNMEGAGSLLVANYLTNVAPKDGTVLGGVNGLLATDGLIYPERVKFDPRTLNWIGSALREAHVGLAWHTAGFKSFDDAFTKQLIIGGSGGTTDSYPQFTNQLLGTKFKIIAGYSGTKTALLAIEKGELTGNVGISWAGFKATNASWLKDKLVSVFVQFGMHKHPELPDTSWIFDYAKTPEDKAAMTLLFATQEFGRPFVAPPGISKELTALLRRAFDETMTDPAFVGDAKQRKIDIDPTSGEEIEELITEIYKTPPAVVQRVKKIFNNQG
jgi:tripartite-type tricarboxylate transporter receptor subunit TctC